MTSIHQLVIGPTPDSSKNITNSMMSIHQSTEMWHKFVSCYSGQLRHLQKYHQLYDKHQSTSMRQFMRWDSGKLWIPTKNINNSITSVQQSTEMWKICELLIGPTPDTFKNVTNSMTSIQHINNSITSVQQTTEMWKICELVIGPTPDSFKKYNQFNDTYSPVN